MTLLLDDESVRGVLDAGALVEAIDRALRVDAERPADVPERLNLAGDGRFFRVMPAVVPASGVMGLKAFFGGGGVGVRYVILLASTETGEILAVLDACYLTAARTAATSVLAARAMGVKGTRLGVLGSGLEAETHLRTFAAVADLEEVKVFSPRPEGRERLSARLRDEFGFTVTACASAAEACADVDHVITATNTGYGGPIACESGWLPAGLHLSAIGSTHQDLRELDTAILRRAGVLLFDADPAQVADESGDIRAYVDEGGSTAGVLLLSDVLQGKVALPEDRPGDLTIFKSVGTALQDLVAAELAYRRAVETGLGRPVDDLAAPKRRR
ncbi:ornithine cyclodeaminase family protein [Frankia sp. AgB1.9]|uniref:ornithine cyclodeaminase family protein n=1 Tax=unclassified Frankia TaxID=2632575 RepID=UPI001932AC92|nr:MULTISPECIES: ornithine cyclodeaminase family protein [unclassified Frankia]MBL7493518.1 ornithine cyclodeaminase family protein [Frankia sp. AgW1.1]MBL7552741.1 ornithine cyclodeaminase family protein [Frankia sp. AgB1.9]MBL7624648.1 ornithine cyclodeaminase family protein [Frankia sp. AgB1.8]